MKQLSLFCVILIIFSCFVDIHHATKSKSKTLAKFRSKAASKFLTKANSGFLKYTKAKVAKDDKKKEKDGKGKQTPENKILWEGWMKYFHFETFRTIRKPSEFFVNYSYYSQKVPKADLKSVDKNGLYKFITGPNLFYGVLLPETLNILSERTHHYSKTVETMDVDLIKPVDPTDPLKGSIKDLGSFDEGHCISVQQIKPSGYQNGFIPLREDATTKNDSWIFCFENAGAKDNFYATLMTYRVLRQKEQKISLVVRESQVKEIVHKTPQYERYEGSDAQPAIDGFLQLMQDWSQCTLKCGGGETYQQWKCVPPKSGGKPCMGELIRKKPCNEQPCPGISQGPEKNEPEVEKEEEINFKPIFKSMPFISRPQQDIPCVVRENDVLYEKVDPKTEKLDKKVRVKVPGRLLINNRTISLFEDNNYDNAVFSYNLQDSTLNPFKDDHCCFFIQSLNKRQKICALSDCGSKAEPKFLNSWKYSFSLFQKKCYRKIETKRVAEKSLDDVQKESSPEMASMNIDEAEVEEREKLINNKLNEQADVFLDKKLEKNQQTALKALTRELNLEERLKREEMMKAKEETNTLIKKMNFENKKKEKLEEALEEKEDQEVKLKSQRETEKQAGSILSETEQEINKKRLGLKKKILEIRKMTQRRKRLIESKINLIRGKMAQEVVQANKQGSQETCETTKSNPAAVTKYCDENVTNDYLKNQDCKTPQNFCYVCCETEFGTVQYNKRAKCYDMCDKDMNKQAELNKPRGDWIWKVNNPQ